MTAGKLSGLLLNGKEYAEDVTEAKKELDSKFKEFDREAQACVHRSLARIQETALDTAATVDKIGSTLIGEDTPNPLLARLPVSLNQYLYNSST